MSQEFNHGPHLGQSYQSSRRYRWEEPAQSTQGWLLSLSGKGGNSECKGRNEVRKARFERKALRLGWKHGGSPSYLAHLGVGGGHLWFCWDLFEGFHRVWVCSCEKWAWPEALLH